DRVALLHDDGDRLLERLQHSGSGRLVGAGLRGHLCDEIRLGYVGHSQPPGMGLGLFRGASERMGTPRVKDRRPCSACDAGAVLTDGTYDVVVVDATDRDDGAVDLDLTVLAGEHKGEVLTITAAGLDRESFDLLAVPGTLTVTDGRPSLRLEG